MKKNLLLLFILVTALYFRFQNINWDANFHLHPDERFLTMVGEAMKIPINPLVYFDQKISTLNPQNIGYKFFVYGTFPLIFNKILAVFFANDNYNDFTLQGRFLSGLADILVVILVFKVVHLFEKKYKYSHWIKYLAAFFYAISVLPIQLSHFFTVDTFLNFFLFASFYFALKFFVAGRYDGSVHNIFFSAIFFGLAFAAKITAIFALPLNLFFILFGVVINRSVRKIVILFFLYMMVAYFVLRIADPYFFENVNFFDPRPSVTFIQNLKTLKSFEGKDIWYPPGVQWINKTPIVFSLFNLTSFGLGLPYFILSIIGIFAVFFAKHLHALRSTFYVILIWLIVFFLYQSSQFAQTMRYFLPIYPFLAMFAAFGFVSVTGPVSNLPHFTFYVLRSTFYVILFIFILIWPLAFSSIYLRKHSRVQASEWIYNNLPTGSRILSEHWDDALPLPVEQNFGKQLLLTELPVFDQDTPEKWKKMDELLQKSDYYILSSNRGWGSIPTVPEKYPKMAEFYKDLLNPICHPERSEGSSERSKRNNATLDSSVASLLRNDEVNCISVVIDKYKFKKIKEFTSYPKLCFMFYELCFMIPDDSSDESFTVYDHPKVMIFKKV